MIASESKKTIIGREEWVSLPSLGVPAIRVKIDSGAKTSALHAYRIQPFMKGDHQYVRFEVHPIQGSRKVVRQAEARVLDKRDVKNSGGLIETRYVVMVPIQLGGETWDIEISLTNRDTMGYRMLLGREAMRGRLIVDPEHSFLLSRNLSDSEAHALYPKEKPNRPSLTIAVLASNPKLYSNKRLIEAGEQRGHKMRFLNISHCYMNVSPSHAAMYYRGGEKLEDFDAVIPRVKPALTFYGTAVLRQFENMGAFCLNEPASIARSRDKLRCLQMLATEGLDMPMTGFANSPQDTEDLVKKVGGAPLVIKLLEGTQGRGVVLAENKKAAESVINAFKSVKANILVQEFVKEAQGRDLRLFVVDGKVIGAMERRAAEGDFRANLHLGGSANAVQITNVERKMAIKAAKAMNLHVAGVDIIRSKTGPKILEINSSPGLEGIESVTQKDIAAAMIECIETHLQKSRPIL